MFWRGLGMRILVMLLLDTLPMLGNVLLLCFFVFFIFGKPEAFPHFWGD
jgi:hypothetical protein